MNDAQALIEAVKSGDLRKVRELIERDPALVSARTAQGESPAIAAAYHRRAGIAELLLAKGADLNVFEAAALGRSEAVQALLDREPGLLHAFSYDGFPLLGLACYFGNEEIARHLLALGASVNEPARNPMKVTALHAAVSGRHDAIVRLLVGAGADVNAGQQGGWTPLMQAAHGGDIAVMRFLLARGADPLARNDEGRTALSLAEEAHQEDAASLLHHVTAGKQS